MYGECKIADFIRIPQNPIPPDADVFDFQSVDNARLRGATFAAPNPRASVVLMAGRSEFIEKYFEVVTELQSRGYNVAMMDWRGQGLSERMLPDSQKGHIPDFAAYRSDLTQFMENHAMKKFEGPWLLMTHSMGGAPGLQLLASGYDKFVGAVLCAPMTRLAFSPIKRNGVRLLAAAACRMGWSRKSIPGVKEHSLEFEGNDLTSDAARHQRFHELQAVAPNAIIREPTYGWMKAASEAMEDLHKAGRFDKMKTPVRIISANRDMLVCSTDHETLAERSPLIDCVTIDGALHEILMERDEFRDQYWTAFDEFAEPLIASTVPNNS